MKLALLLLLPLLVAGQGVSPFAPPSVTPSAAPSVQFSEAPSVPPEQPPSSPSSAPPFAPPSSAAPSPSPDPSPGPTIPQVTPAAPVPSLTPVPSIPDSPPPPEDTLSPEGPAPTVSTAVGLPPLPANPVPTVSTVDGLPPLPANPVPTVSTVDGLPPLPANPVPTVSTVDGLPPLPANPAPTSSPEAPIRKGQAIYHLTDKGVKCLDVCKDWRYDGSPVQLYDCNETPAQKWVLNKANTAVRLAGTNYCLDAGSHPANFVTMKIWQCYDIPAQHWYFTNDDRIAVTDKGLCLDLKNGKTYKNGRGVVQTYKCTDHNTNQVWTVRKPHRAERKLRRTGQS